MHLCDVAAQLVGFPRVLSLVQLNVGVERQADDLRRVDALVGPFAVPGAHLGVDARLGSGRFDKARSPVLVLVASGDGKLGFVHVRLVFDDVHVGQIGGFDFA